MINITRMIAQARTELERYVDRKLADLVGFTLTATSSSLGDQDSVQKSDLASDGQRPVQRLETWGFRGRPPAKVRGMWFKLGTSNVAFIGLLPTQGYGPQDLDVGESAMFNTTKALVRLFSSGNVGIDSDTDGSADVVVNGGSLKVARDTDPVDLGAWTLVYTPASGPGVTDSGSVVLTVKQPGAGSPTTIGSSTALSGKISDGADHFKG